MNDLKTLFVLAAPLGLFACSEVETATAETPLAPAAAAEAGPALIDAYSQRFADRPIPQFKVDPAWPEIPSDLILGQMPGVAVDSHDNVWVIQRPNSLGFSDTGADREPPIAVCCKAAPHVVKFAQDGTFLSAWGGPEIVPDIDGVEQWPANVHGIYVDENDTVWIGGNGDNDHVVLNFTAEGEFIRQYGQREQTAGNFDRATLGNPADAHHDPEANELVIADGYINKRVIGFDTEANEFSRFFGAYAVAPDAETREGTFDQSQASSNSDGGANPTAESFGDIVHCVNKGPDGLIYVCDRRNNRIQVFGKNDAGETTFVKDIVVAAETGGTRSASDVAWSPDGTYMYVADMMNGQVWILDAETHEFLGAVGRNGRYPGEFIWLHSVDVDSDGNLYTTEVSTGRRVQKFVLTGIE